MRLTKYLQLDPTFIIKKIPLIFNFLKDQYKVTKFYLDISSKDTDYRFDSIEEFNQTALNIKNTYSFLFSINVKDGEKKIQIKFQSTSTYQDIRCVSIEIDGDNTLAGDSLISNLANLLNIKIYKYNLKRDTEHVVKKEIEKCINILSNIQNLHSRRDWNINNEKDIQKFLYPIIKSHFEELEDEFYLQTFANISYKPDFGIPKLKLLIEVKLIRQKTDLNKIQKEIIDDSVGYTKSSNKYKNIIIYIYNKANIAITPKYIKDIEKINVIEKVIISPGIQPKK